MPNATSRLTCAPMNYLRSGIWICTFKIPPSRLVPIYPVFLSMLGLLFALAMCSTTKHELERGSLGTLRVTAHAVVAVIPSLSLCFSCTLELVFLCSDTQYTRSSGLDEHNDIRNHTIISTKTCQKWDVEESSCSWVSILIRRLVMGFARLSCRILLLSRLEVDGLGREWARSACRLPLLTTRVGIGSKRPGVFNHNIPNRDCMWALRSISIVTIPVFETSV